MTAVRSLFRELREAVLTGAARALPDLREREAALGVDFPHPPALPPA